MNIEKLDLNGQSFNIRDGDAVHVNGSDSFSEEQQAKARENIGAATQSKDGIYIKGNNSTIELAVFNEEDETGYQRSQINFLGNEDGTVRLTRVTDGKDDWDAATVGQLNATVVNTETSLSSLQEQISTNAAGIGSNRIDIDNNMDAIEALNKTVGDIGNAIKYIDNQDKENRPVLRDFESGLYVLKGYFYSYSGGQGIIIAEASQCNIARYEDRTEAQLIYASGNRIIHFYITDSSYERRDVELDKVETVDNRVTAIDETADDEHYPTAKAVYDAISGIEPGTEDAGSSSISHCWQGKNVVFLGDSIAQGYTDQGNVATPYPQVVANNLGMTLTNYGIGGSTVAQQENYGGAFKTQAEFEAAEKDTSKIYQVITGQGKKTYEYDSDTSTWVNSSENVRTPLSARWSFMRDDADLIVVQSGTNDFQYDWTPVGTMADRTPYTFYGALHTMFAGLIEKYKGKTIVFLTSLKRAQTPYTTPESQNSYGLTLSDYRDIMLEVCDYYGVPVIDVFSVSGLNPYLESQANLFDNAKTHPLQWGHNRLGDIVSTRLLCVQRFDTAGAIEDDGGDDDSGDDTGTDTNEPITATWNENKALQTGNTELEDMNYRTTCDFVAIPESGLTITLTDDDIEMCVSSYTVNQALSQAMSSYLTDRSYSVSYETNQRRYVRVMVRSISNPNSVLITAEQAAAGVQFTAT